MISFMLLGELRYRSDEIKVFVITDLPEPVVPAIRRCGILPKSATTARPEISFPTAKVNGDVASFQASLSRMPRSRTSAAFTLGISIPTRRVPGIGASIRILSTARFRANSLSRASILERLTPAGGRSVYWVTRGPT